MRNRVSAVGIVMYIGRSVRLSVEGRVDAFGQLSTDPTDLHEFLDARLRQAAEATEVFEQRRAPARADAGDLLQRTRFARPLAPAAVTRDREPVRLVAHRLHEVRGRRLRP